jgi:alkaline phosphatase D
MVGIMGLLSVIASVASIAVLERTRGSEERDRMPKQTTRIAFGSGTSVDYRPQPIWVQGIMPSNPDAFIW